MKKHRFMAITVTGLICLLSNISVGAQSCDFYAYYTKVHPEQDSQEYSITGKYADIVVHINDELQFIFWRASSYLPCLKTPKGKWYVDEIVARSGDGSKIRPDKYNLYSYVRIIENSPSKVVIHWRYMPDFSYVEFDGVVHEYYTVTSDGRVVREIRKGTEKIDDWNDPANKTVQTLQLSPTGIKELSIKRPALTEAAGAPVAGSPVKTGAVGRPVAWWKFNEGLGPNEDQAQESISAVNCVIGGNKSFWKKGISGTALGFDGYYSKVTLPASKTPSIKSGLTVEAWVALGAYPFDWAPIVHQCEWEKNGYYFGVDTRGQAGLMIAVGDRWEVLSSTEQIPLNRWTHLVGTFDKSSGKMQIYIDGVQKGTKEVAKNDVTIAEANLQIGLNSMKLPASGLPAIIGIEGLIDEVKIYDVALSSSQVSQSYKNFKPDASLGAHPDSQSRILPGQSGKAEKFGAYYTNLQYHDLWDSMWRTGEHPDIAVKFDELPTSVVFWHGTSYGPGFVTENNIWMIDQSIETGHDDTGCCEHMSDKQCRFSHVRLIENTNARVVVHWRYAYVSAALEFPSKFPPTNQEWPSYKSWGDEYYTIYPDGVIVRKVHDRSGANVFWQDIQFLSPPGQTPENQLDLQALTLAGIRFWAGITMDTLALDWTEGVPKNTLSNANMELINFKSKYKVYLIFPIGTFISPWARGGRYSHFPAWNHWPVAQIPSDGRGALFTDRVTHSALAAADNAALHGNRVIYGFTDNEISSVLPLSLSWNYPPELSNTKGCQNKGFDKDQRAYILQAHSSQISFDLIGSEISPIYNPCFVIKNWDSNNKVSLKINGREQKPGPDFRQGITRDTDGTQTMIVWIKTESTEPIRITLSPIAD